MNRKLDNGLLLRDFLTEALCCVVYQELWTQSLLQFNTLHTSQEQV